MDISWDICSTIGGDVLWSFPINFQDALITYRVVFYDKAYTIGMYCC